MTLAVARIAVETGISPNELLETPPDVFYAIIAVLNERAREAEKAR